MATLGPWVSELRGQRRRRRTRAQGRAQVPQAVGVFEAAALPPLKAYGLSQTGALPYALVLHVANFVPFVVLGVLTLHLGARRPRGLAEAATYT